MGTVHVKSLCNSGRLRLLVPIFFCLLASSAFAQFDTGSITGTVTDSTGAIVPRAPVTVTNVNTGIQTDLAADQRGIFVASDLPFGTYVVAVKASGFAETKSSPIKISVGAMVQLNLVLAVAASQETVQVNGTSTTVDTSSSTSGTTLDTNQVANLPINGRDVSSFLEIAPGSVGSTGFFQGSVNGLDNIFTGLNITLDGQSAMRGDINGFLDTEGQEGARITRSSIDSIQEIDYANSGYTAENGHSLGPQMNIITKSGTNSYHGELFEFSRTPEGSGKVGPRLISIAALFKMRCRFAEEFFGNAAKIIAFRI